MSQKKDLLKNTMIITIGKLSTRVVSFLLLPLYTYLLSKEQYGSFDLLNTLSIFFVPIITLQLEEAMFRFLIDAKNNNEEKSKIFTGISLYAIFSFIFWGVIIFLVGKYILHYNFVVWLILYLLSSVMFNISSSISRGMGNFKLFSGLSFASAVLNIVLNILFITVFKMKAEGLFLAYILSSILVAIYGFIKQDFYKYLNFKNIDKNYLKDMIKFSLPLVPNIISWDCIALTDRLVITNLISYAANGIYSVANKFPTIITTFYGFFNVSWRESASKMVNQEDKDEFYNSIYTNLKNILIGVAILIIAIMPFAFKILINKEFNEAYIYIPLMIISTYYANMSNFSSGIFAAYKNNKILAPTTFMAAIINLIIGFVGVKYLNLGMFAPILGTLTAYFIINRYRNYKMKEYINLINTKNNYLNVVILLVVCLLYFNKYLISNIIINYTLYTLGLIIAIIYVYYINKDIILDLFNSIKRKIHKNG